MGPCPKKAHNLKGRKQTATGEDTILQGIGAATLLLPNKESLYSKGVALASKQELFWRFWPDTRLTR